ncbi:MAG: phosphoribosylformylglycinamidine synthase subunit PurQ [Saprospiraceae bacterium]|jgi:phosphoribosylformylglycinamidine synthase I|nr:phosphoribosylformylglycinamidine synthase subunit PurQ [Saprospiraceae bacterium]
MKFGVVVFPGSNCDDDMVHVLQDVLNQDVVKLWHKTTDLPPGLDCVVLPGGFSYGDYVRAGAIAQFSPIMKAVKAFAEAGGYVFGVCNGFQILCEAHLLPGVLLRNANQQFICDNVWIKPATNNSPLTAGLDLSRALKIPIAHAEGRFFADEKTLNELETNDQVLFRYCTPAGEVTPSANPNGAARNIAGICNARRNVFGMMPHPERAAEQVLANIDGYGLFQALVA